LRRCPVAVVLSEHPLIVSHDGFLKSDDIKELLAATTQGDEKTTVVDNESGESVYSNYRTGKLGYVADGLPIAEKIMARLVSITNVRRCQIEGFQVLRYGIADQYLPHTDFFHPGVPAYKKQITYGGQRIMSVIMCLQEPEEGGALDFPQIKLTHKLKVGEAVLFWDLDKEGRGDFRTEHAAMPVVKGEKISLVCWIRERAFDGSEEKAPPPTEQQLRGMLQQSKNVRQVECAKAIEKALEYFGCGLNQTSKPMVDNKTGLIKLKPEFRVEAK
jgi:prolyl 4-hydroxylase